MSVYFGYYQDNRPLTEAEKKARKKAERERKRKEARENAEKKKRFGLTPEKKRKLKILIMQKATEDLQNEAKRKAEAKNNYLAEKVPTLPDLDAQNEGIEEKIENRVLNRVIDV